jgi:hypothetical protein
LQSFLILSLLKAVFFFVGSRKHYVLVLRVLSFQHLSGHADPCLIMWNHLFNMAWQSTPSMLNKNYFHLIPLLLPPSRFVLLLAYIDPLLRYGNHFRITIISHRVAITG